MPSKAPASNAASQSSITATNETTPAANLKHEHAPIQWADTDERILACRPVFIQLRLPWADRTEVEFLAQVKLQHQQAGYRLAYVGAESGGSGTCDDGGIVKGVAGVRFQDNFCYGRFCYVDDLITDSNSRSEGWGGALLQGLMAYSKAEGCAQLHLDSGVVRYDAHRFYLNQRMMIASHHFSIDLV